jgi:phage shock protein C
MRSSEERQEGRRRRHEKRSQRRAQRHPDRYEFHAEFQSGEPRGRDYGVTLYRSRTGMICGVCEGIADYYHFSTFWVRVLFVIGSSFFGFWPAIVAYFIASMVMKVEPVLPLESEEDEEFYHSYSGSRSMALQRLKRTYESLDRRIQRIESTVTTRDFDWEQRLNR